jgi:hypothetical protein
MDLAIASGQDPQAAMELITGGVNSTALSASTMDGSMTGEITYKVGMLSGRPGNFVAPFVFFGSHAPYAAKTPPFLNTMTIFVLMLLCCR